jgi:membrane associated rhomboid family serine protease
VKPFKPPSPLATNTLIGLCVAVQAGGWLGGRAFAAAMPFAFGLIPARISAAFAGNADIGPALATFITHIFVHGGLLHLGLNMIFLAWVGRYVEWVTGRTALIAIFLAGGIAGGALQVLSNAASPIPVVGASGAIAAVFGAYAVMFARSRASARQILGLTISGETLTALWYAAAWIGLQLLTGLVLNTSDGYQIAIWTHIGGFVIGLLLGRFWGRGPQPD